MKKPAALPAAPIQGVGAPGALYLPSRCILTLLKSANSSVNVNQTNFDVARIAELLRSPQRRSRVTELETTDEKGVF